MWDTEAVVFVSATWDVSSTRYFLIGFIHMCIINNLLVAY